MRKLVDRVGVPRWTRLSWTVVLVVLCGSSTALAEERDADYVPFGVLLSFDNHRGQDSYAGVGAEVSWVHYPPSGLTDSAIGVADGTSWFGYGLFAQVEQLGAFDHARFAVGPQVNYHLFGLEAGAAIETGGDSYAGTASVHLAPFISAGFASIAFRASIPVAKLTDGGERYGLDLGVAMTLKYPFPVQGRTRDFFDWL